MSSSDTNVALRRLQGVAKHLGDDDSPAHFENCKYFVEIIMYIH